MSAEWVGVFILQNIDCKNARRHQKEHFDSLRWVLFEWFFRFLECRVIHFRHIFVFLPNFTTLFSQALPCWFISFNNAGLSPINVLLRRDTVGILYRCLVFDCIFMVINPLPYNVRGLSARRNRSKVLYIHPRILQKV